MKIKSLVLLCVLLMLCALISACQLEKFAGYLVCPVNTMDANSCESFPQAKWSYNDGCTAPSERRGIFTERDGTSVKFYKCIEYEIIRINNTTGKMY